MHINIYNIVSLDCGDFIFVTIHESVLFQKKLKFFLQK